MTSEKKQLLVEEARKQCDALVRISKGRTTLLTFSALGVMLAYFGFSANPIHLLMGIAGIVLCVLGLILAMVCHMGIKAGNKNVENILNEAEKLA